MSATKTRIQRITSRSYHVLARTSTTTAVELTIHRGDHTSSTSYLVERLPGPDGQNLLTWHKFNSREAYTVRLDNPQDFRCDCKDFEFGGGNCKHVCASKLMIVRGEV